MSNSLLTPIVLGFTGGISPGAVFLSAFSEILAEKKSGIKRAINYLLIAAATELSIACFLVFFSNILIFPPVVFSILSIIGSFILLAVAWQIFKIKDMNSGQGKILNKWEIFLYMLSNGPLWMFWITVCVPEAIRLESSFHYGRLYFVVIFQLSMMISMGILIAFVYWFRDLLDNRKIIRILFISLSVLMVIISFNLIYSSVIEIFKF